MHATSAERAVAYEAQAIARCRRYGQDKTAPRLQQGATLGGSKLEQHGTPQNMVIREKRQSKTETYIKNESFMKGQDSYTDLIV